MRDIFRYYRSDIAAAIEAGAETPAALGGVGGGGSHGWGRTEVASLGAAYDLVSRGVTTPPTFADWDARPTGSVEDFPAEDQPAASEQWVPLNRGEFTDPGSGEQGSTWPPQKAD